MEHYQTNGTREGSTVKHAALTPMSPKSTVTGRNEETIPQELCENCCHGLQVRLCIENNDLSASEIASLLS